MSIALLLVLAAQSSQPSTRPTLQTGGTGADLKAKAILMVDIEEDGLNMSESWTLNNSSGKVVGQDHVDFPLTGAKLLRVDEDVQGFVAREDSSGVHATGPLASGSKTVSFAYLQETHGSKLTIRRQIPVNVDQGMLIFPGIEDLSVASNHPMKDRMSEMNGRKFLVYDFDGLKAGSVLELTITGLPSHSAAPRFVAGAAAIAILGWMFFALSKGASQRREAVLGALSADARRDRIVKALDLLERDFQSEAIKEKRYKRRHGELMAELAAVLREIELSTTES